MTTIMDLEDTITYGGWDDEFCDYSLIDKWKKRCVQPDLDVDEDDLQSLADYYRN